MNMNAALKTWKSPTFSAYYCPNLKQTPVPVNASANRLTIMIASNLLSFGFYYFPVIRLCVRLAF